MKSSTSTTRPSTENRYNPVVSALIVKLNHNAVDNGDIEVYTSNYMPDPYKTAIKLEDNDEIDHLLEFLHSRHDGNRLDVDLQMFQS